MGILNEFSSLAITVIIFEKYKYFNNYEGKPGHLYWFVKKHLKFYFLNASHNTKCHHMFSF